MLFCYAKFAEVEPFRTIFTIFHGYDVNPRLLRFYKLLLLARPVRLGIAAGTTQHGHRQYCVLSEDQHRLIATRDLDLLHFDPKINCFLGFIMAASVFEILCGNTDRQTAMKTYPRHCRGRRRSREESFLCYQEWTVMIPVINHTLVFMLI